MAIEISFDAMSPEAKAMLLDNATSSTTLGRSTDPLELLMELEQLAADEGFTDIHTFISYYLNTHTH